RNRLEKRRSQLIVEVLRRKFLLLGLRQSAPDLGAEIRDGVLSNGFRQHERSSRSVSAAPGGTTSKRTDSAAGTNCRTTAAAWTRRSAAIRPSSRSAARQKNRLNSRDRTGTPEIQETARTLYASTPSRCPANRAHRRRWRLSEMPPLESGPTAQNRNFLASH